MIHLTKEEIHLEENTEIFVIRNVLTAIEEVIMHAIAGQEENQDPQELIVMIATQKDIKMKEEDIDLQEDIEMIIEEETEEVQMIGILREPEEPREVIQEKEVEITIELVQEIIDEVEMIMIEEDPKDIMTQEIKVIKKQVDLDPKVKIEKKDTMKNLKKATEGIREKVTITIETETKDLKMKEMNIIREMRAKDLKTFINK
jgi:hypothetical protein